MITRTSVSRMLLSSFMWIIALSVLYANKENPIQLYTTNTKISIPPGESISYNIEVKNIGDKTQYCNLSVSGLPLFQIS